MRSRFFQALALAWAYITGGLEDRREAKTIWALGFFCDKTGCFGIGQYRAERWKACRAHADELVDLLLSGFSDAFNSMQKREQAGEFLTPDTSRGFPVFKGGGYMGPPRLR